MVWIIVLGDAMYITKYTHTHRVHSTTYKRTLTHTGGCIQPPTNTQTHTHTYTHTHTHRDVHITTGLFLFPPPKEMSGVTCVYRRYVKSSFVSTHTSQSCLPSSLPQPDVPLRPLLLTHPHLHTSTSYTACACCLLCRQYN